MTDNAHRFSCGEQVGSTGDGNEAAQEHHGDQSPISCHRSQDDLLAGLLIDIQFFHQIHSLQQQPLWAFM